MSFDLSRSSGYGHASANSGYGASRYVDCNSALALLGFILFIDILRDIIEEVTEEDPTRKKRWAIENASLAGGGGGRVWESEPDILTFVSEGGADHMYHTLPEILTPLLAGWMELQGEADGQCLEQSVCQGNWVLASHYGTTGRVLATLLSNVASRALSGGDEAAMAATLRAAREGRRRQRTCEAAFPACPSLPPRHAHPLYANTTAIANILSNNLRETGPPLDGKEKSK